MKMKNEPFKNLVFISLGFIDDEEKPYKGGCFDFGPKNFTNS